MVSTQARGINPQGDIVGFYVSKDGAGVSHTHGFVATKEQGRRRRQLTEPGNSRIQSITSWSMPALRCRDGGVLELSGTWETEGGLSITSLGNKGRMPTRAFHVGRREPTQQFLLWRTFAVAGEQRPETHCLSTATRSSALQSWRYVSAIAGYLNASSCASALLLPAHAAPAVVGIAAIEKYWFTPGGPPTTNYRTEHHRRSGYGAMGALAYARGLDSVAWTVTVAVLMRRHSIAEPT